MPKGKYSKRRTGKRKKDELSELHKHFLLDKIATDTGMNYDRWGKEKTSLVFGWMEVFLILILSTSFGFFVYTILNIKGVEPMVMNVLLSLLCVSAASSLLTFRFLLRCKEDNKPIQIW